jgi:hypothetical protein
LHGWIDHSDDNNASGEGRMTIKPKGSCAMLAAKSVGKGLRDADPGTAGEHLGGLRDVDHRDGGKYN